MDPEGRLREPAPAPRLGYTVMTFYTAVVYCHSMVQDGDSGALLARLEDSLRTLLPADWQVRVEPSGKPSELDGRVELVSPTGERTLAAVEAKPRLEPAMLLRELPWLEQRGPVIVVAPSISERARALLEQARVGWLEPDGDARIAIGGLLIDRRGTGDRRPAPSRTRYVADLFAGGALRIVRWLLIDPRRAWTVAEMAIRAGVTEGFVSRTFKTLARDAYVQRARRATRPADPDGLLDAWTASKPQPEQVREAVSLLGGPEAVLRRVPNASPAAGYALTAEAAADRISPYARYSRVELYVNDLAAPWDELLELTTVPRGGNVILRLPTDPGVFDGAFESGGLRLVNRPQLYVDLVRGGGAAADAAAMLRDRGLLWPQ